MGDRHAGSRAAGIAAQPRSVRGHLRALRPGQRLRVLRGLPVQLRGGRGTLASLDARRLAAAAMGDGAARFAANTWPLEDARQPAAGPAGTVLAGAADHRLRSSRALARDLSRAGT